MDIGIGFLEKSIIKFPFTISTEPEVSSFIFITQVPSLLKLNLRFFFKYLPSQTPYITLWLGIFSHEITKVAIERNAQMVKLMRYTILFMIIGYKFFLYPLRTLNSWLGEKERLQLYTLHQHQHPSCILIQGLH